MTAGVKEPLQTPSALKNAKDKQFIDSQTRLVLARQFTAQFAGLGVGVPGVPSALAAFQTVGQANAARALAPVAHKLVVANRLQTK